MAIAKAFSFVRLIYFLALLLLAGCADTGTAIWQTMRQAASRSGEPDASRLDPRLRYLRISSEAGVAFLVLGAIDRDANGPIEVWYSGDAQILRLQNGRLAGHTGLLPEWHSVSLPNLPPWSSVAKEAKPLHWERVRDVTPGYRFGVRDKLVLVPIAAPRSSDLRGIDAQSLTWFEERTEADSAEKLPPARYAIQGDTVVYGEQCVSPRSCLKWQRWRVGS